MAEASHRQQRRWKPSILTWCIATLVVAGTTAGLYPSTAAWFTSYNQSKVISTYDEQLKNLTPGRDEQLEMAHEYNKALLAGVSLDKNANIPTGTGVIERQGLDYSAILSANDKGMMARVKIPKIDVDLPIYHGTSDEVLDIGAGHLEGSHLPVGGVDMRSVITAHRGLANATMFTNLDRVERGDMVNIEVFGEMLSYQVIDTKVIDPEDTEVLRAEPGMDLISLITCTPLGINTQRIVVTASRVSPTPPEVAQQVGQVPTIPGFPWWVVIGAGVTGLVSLYVYRQGFTDARLASKKNKTTASERDSQAAE